jgi:hypothetical protein
MANSIAFDFRTECSVAELKIKATAGFRKPALRAAEKAPYNSL